MMSKPVEWKGTQERGIMLNLAIKHNCPCQDEDKMALCTCSAGWILTDQRALDGLLFMSFQVDRLRKEEGLL